MNALPLLPAVAIAGLSVASFATTPLGDQTCSTTQAAAGQKNIIETAVGAGQFTTLAAALGAADLVDALQGEGPFTVFAPSDAAFAKLPKETLASLLEPENRATLANILTYHVVAGRVEASDVVKLSTAGALNGQRIRIDVDDAGVRASGAAIVTTDIQCTNGIIHVIDEVMLPNTKDIVATASEAGVFKTLVAALGAGGLVEALQSEGPFTVFAPTDEAFAALPEGTVAWLLEPENREQLVSILKYHVVEGRVYADQLKDGKARTLQGSSLKIQLRNGEVLIGNARVTSADLDTTNGVVHVIDAVVLPQ